MDVYLLHHEHDDEIKLIGVYSTYEKAQEALERVRDKPGFRDTPQGFSIDRYRVDQDQWVEGYFTYFYEGQ